MRKLKYKFNKAERLNHPNLASIGPQFQEEFHHYRKKHDLEVNALYY